MHSRRLACLLLGLWLGGDWALTWAVNQNQHAVGYTLDRVGPEATLLTKAVGRTQTRLLLHYQASEQNRALLENWGMAQLFFGAFCFFFLLFGTTEGKFSLLLVLLVLVFLVIQRFLIVPEVIGLGRTFDFIAELSPGQRRQLDVVQKAYNFLDYLKWGLVLLLAALIWRSRGRSGDAGQEFDLIDKAYHGHVDR